MGDDVDGLGAGAGDEVSGAEVSEGRSTDVVVVVRSTGAALTVLDDEVSSDVVEDVGAGSSPSPSSPATSQTTSTATRAAATAPATTSALRWFSSTTRPSR